MKCVVSKEEESERRFTQMKRSVTGVTANADRKREIVFYSGERREERLFSIAAGHETNSYRLPVGERQLGQYVRGELWKGAKRKERALNQLI